MLGSERIRVKEAGNRCPRHPLAHLSELSPGRARVFPSIPCRVARRGGLGRILAFRRLPPKGGAGILVRIGQGRPVIDMSAFAGRRASEPGRRASRREFHEWLIRRPGSLILDAERAHLDRMLPDLFGYHLVQVGRLADANLLARSRILGQTVIELDADPGPFRHPVVHGRASALPLESDGVDVVVMPHVLEFEAEPHEAVREASRVLVPEGHLVITGFNPWSLFGVWRLALHSRGPAPWCGQFISPSRLKDWLALLGFDVLEMGSHFRRPPLRSQRLLNRFGFLEHAAMPLSSVVGAAYVALARKRVTTLTRVRPRWRPRRRLAVVGLAGPSASNVVRRRFGA